MRENYWKNANKGGVAFPTVLRESALHLHVNY